jgi:hypothetical protein
MKTTFNSTTLLFISFLSLALFGSTCRKDIHLSIEVVNNSDIDVIYARSIQNIQLKCILDGPLIKAKGTYEDRRNFGWDGVLAYGRIDTVYFIDPKKYNELLKFYECDSIYIKNDIIKMVEITSEMMRRNGWKIIYE